MKKKMFLCLTVCLWAAVTLSAQMNLWRNGNIMLSVEPEQVDSLTFVPQVMEELDFTFALQDVWHILVTPSRNDVDYIWVATSDADYAYYGYTSYEEAWQTTVDVAKQWDALEEWNMVVRGATVVDMTDATWNTGHYVLAVAGWDGDARSSALTMYAFTLSDEGAVPDAENVVKRMHTATDNKCSTLVQLWQEGKVKERIPLNGIDSVTFVQPKPEPVFYLSVTDVTNVSFRATVVPIDEQMYYFVDYVDKKIADGYTDDEFAKAYLAQLVDVWQKQYPKEDFADVFLYQGTKTLRFSEGVMGDTDYYLVCFAVDPATRTLASPLYKCAFKTEPTPENPDLTFEVSVNEKHVATIIPSDDTSTYYWTTFTKADLSKYGTPEEVWKANAAQWGNAYSSHGKSSFSIVHQFLEAGTVYLAVAGWNGKQTTRIFVWEFEVTEDMLPF